MAGRRQRRRAGFALAGALLALTGCGDDETTTAPSAPTKAAKGNDGDARLPTGDGRGGVGLAKLGDFEQPLYVTQPSDGSGDLYVVEQGGRVMRLAGGSGKPEVFLDLSGEVTCCGEQGLLSVAFAPDYAKSGLLYVDYTNREGDTRVVEYRRSGSDPPVADPGSARELLAVDQPFPNHNGGLVLFGPDRKLYIGLGDGGGGGDPDRNGQDLSTLLGKILRIEPTPADGRPYGVPADNPFVDRQGARPEIFSYGLRNPWRFSFDRLDDDLWIGDVGQDSLEEIDGVSRGEASGANFGWSAFEGSDRFNRDQSASGTIPPVLTYPLDGACAVTGGFVVRDPALPSLFGRYLYGDYCLGELRSFTADPGFAAADDRPLGLQVPGLSSFGEDTEGHIYATSIEGPVYRLDGAAR